MASVNWAWSYENSSIVFLSFSFFVSLRLIGFQVMRILRQHFSFIVFLIFLQEQLEGIVEIEVAVIFFLWEIRIFVRWNYSVECFENWRVLKRQHDFASNLKRCSGNTAFLVYFYSSYPKKLKALCCLLYSLAILCDKKENEVISVWLTKQNLFKVIVMLIILFNHLNSIFTHFHCCHAVCVVYHTVN